LPGDAFQITTMTLHVGDRLLQVCVRLGHRLRSRLRYRRSRARLLTQPLIAQEWRSGVRCAHGDGRWRIAVTVTGCESESSLRPRVPGRETHLGVFLMTACRDL
jgi:hypothetical protein